MITYQQAIAEEASLATRIKQAIRSLLQQQGHALVSLEDKYYYTDELFQEACVHDVGVEDDRFFCLDEDGNEYKEPPIYILTYLLDQVEQQKYDLTDED